MRLASWIRFETLMTSEDWHAIGLLVSNLHRSNKDLLLVLQKCVATTNSLHGRSTSTSTEKFQSSQGQAMCVCPMANGHGQEPTGTDPVQGSVYHPGPLSTTYFHNHAKTKTTHGLQVDITPTAAGLQSMHECRIAFPPWSKAAVFCPAHFQQLDYEQSTNSNTVHMGCQTGKACRLVLQESDKCYSVLALLLAFTTRQGKRKGEESPSKKLPRMSSPRTWDVALVVSVRFCSGNQGCWHPFSHCCGTWSGCDLTDWPYAANC